MKFTKYIILSLILVELVAPCSFGATNISATLKVNVSSSIQIKALNSKEVTSIDCNSGNMTLVSPQFSLKSNCNCAKIGMTASVQGKTTRTAFCEIDGVPCLTFANTSMGFIPSDSSIISAQHSGASASSNPNVISYPVTTGPNTGSLTMTFSNARSPFGSGKYFSIAKTGGGVLNGSVRLNISGAPASGTYLFGSDSAGTYQAIVTVSAYEL
ncbi:MAG: hypothetical protein PHV37_08935 [Candidatus Gastranaerophilales bacterium]|nr:hypothetical protein [Candidatus Gastranaerophilales bacterium]